MSLKNRVKKLEQKNSTQDNPVTKIVIRYIDKDGSVSGTRVSKLINGVWCKDVEEEKSTN